MKKVYPIVVTPVASKMLVSIPDFHVNAEASDLVSAIDIARETIGMMGIELEDNHEELPIATNSADICL